MKNPVNLIIICVLSLMLLSCTKPKKTIFILNDNYVSLKIASGTTRQELEKISAKLLKEKNIKIDFSKSTFKKNGLIRDLKLEVDCQDGYSGTAEATNEALQTDYYGFERTYNKVSDSSFSTGQLKE